MTKPFTLRPGTAITDKGLLSNDKRRCLLIRIRFELENNFPVKNNRFHIKKSILDKQSPAQSQRYRRRNRVRETVSMFMLQKLAKPLFIRNFIYFVPKSSLKTKEQNRKKSIPWSLLLYLSKHKFLVRIVMFLK